MLLLPQRGDYGMSLEDRCCSETQLLRSAAADSIVFPAFVETQTSDVLIRKLFAHTCTSGSRHF